MKSNNLIITIVVAIVVGAAAFFGGMQYQKSQATMSTGQFSQGRNGGRFGGGNRGNITVGEIVSSDQASITIKLMDGSSKIVNISSATTISKTTTTGKTDLTTGTRVAAIGAANSDGSITAQNIQINPMFRTGAGGGMPRPTQ